MRTMTQMEALDELPDDDMGKRIILKILNTPPMDFTELKKESEEYCKQRLAELSPEDRARVLAME